MDDRPKIQVAGVDFEWDPANGLMLIWGKPVVCMWLETTMAGLLSGLQKMVGPERFRLAFEQAGRDSAIGEWNHIILPRPSIDEGLKFIGQAMGTVGLGVWEPGVVDYDAKEFRIRGRNDWESLYQKALGKSWGSSSLMGKLGYYGTQMFGTHCRAEQVSFINRGDECDEFVVRPANRTIDEDLDELLATEHATRADLTSALERLRSEVEERRRVEEDLRREVEERKRIEEELTNKADLVRRQEEAIRAMSTPILQLWDGVLTMPVIGLMDSTRASMMMESLLAAITEKQARFTILDLTGVEVIDSAAASHVLSLVQAARLLGTQCLVSGISPAMASTIVSIGLDLSTLKTFGTLEAALRFAIKASR